MEKRKGGNLVLQGFFLIIWVLTFLPTLPPLFFLGAKKLCSKEFYNFKYFYITSGLEMKCSSTEKKTENMGGGVLMTIDLPNRYFCLYFILESILKRLDPNIFSLFVDFAPIKEMVFIFQYWGLILIQ